MNELIDYRQIASEYFQKELLPDEVVHHIDGNHDNNDPENLVIMKKSQHSKVHALFNFENWRKTHHPICNTCLFVALYDLEIESGKSTFDLLCDIGMKMNYQGVKATYPIHEKYGFEDVKGEEYIPGMLDFIYQASMRWKKEHNHDCYENKHMEVVHV